MSELNDYKNIGSSQSVWVLSGAAGFVGSSLLEKLLLLNQKVVALDNFSTGQRKNLDEVKQAVGEALWGNLAFYEGDVRDADLCKKICKGADYVLHQAALGSVPRSLKNPQETHLVNVDGFLNMLIAARDANVKKFVYASSSSVYGDNTDLPKTEEKIGKPLSPYAAGKLMNEIYASVFSRSYGLKTVGLRYFNVFGPRQSPEGEYAAVIPRWINGIVKKEQCTIYGDGKTSRDFCYVDNVVQANLLAAVSENSDPDNYCVLNIGNNANTTLTELYNMIQEAVISEKPKTKRMDPLYTEFRAGDIRHSQADISKAAKVINYQPLVDIREGISKTVKYACK